MLLKYFTPLNRLALRSTLPTMAGTGVRTAVPSTQGTDGQQSGGAGAPAPQQSVDLSGARQMLGGPTGMPANALYMPSASTQSDAQPNQVADAAQVAMGLIQARAAQFERERMESQARIAASKSGGHQGWSGLATDAVLNYSSNK